MRMGSRPHSLSAAFRLRHRADQGNCRLYFYNFTSRQPTVVAGIQGRPGYDGDGSLALESSFSSVLGGVAASAGSTGLVYVCDGGGLCRSSWFGSRPLDAPSSPRQETGPSASSPRRLRASPRSPT